MTIDGQQINVGTGGNKVGTTIILDSQALTDAQIRAYAEQLAGGPLGPPGSGVAGIFTRTASDGTIVTLRSISTSYAETEARWTIQINNSDALSNVLRSSRFELKFR